MAKNGTRLGLVDLITDVPQVEHLVVKSDTTSGKFGIWLTFGSS